MTAVMPGPIFIKNGYWDLKKKRSKICKKMVKRPCCN